MRKPYRGKAYRRVNYQYYIIRRTHFHIKCFCFFSWFETLFIVYRISYNILACVHKYLLLYWFDTYAYRYYLFCILVIVYSIFTGFSKWKPKLFTIVSYRKTNKLVFQLHMYKPSLILQPRNSFTIDTDVLNESILMCFACVCIVLLYLRWQEVGTH